MAETTNISWCDATWNPWIGCSKVSTGALGACELCYAERDNGHRHWVSGWGHGVPRRRTAPANWKQPIRWDRAAAEAGKPLRVFCASLADVFDNEVPQEWRDDLWQIVRMTPHLRWLLLTKRIGNAPDMLPFDWPYQNAGLGATIVTQKEWDRDFPKLSAIPAAFHFVSDEPTLAPIDIGAARPDWVITGGESGVGFRPLNMNYVRSMRDQCSRNGVTFHHKQNGGVRGKDAGCLVDGVEHKHFPPALAA